MNKSKSYKDMYNSINARVDTLAEALSVVNPAIDRVWVEAAIDNHFDGRAVDYNNPYLSRKADAPVVTNVVKFTPPPIVVETPAVATQPVMIAKVR